MAVISITTPLKQANLKRLKNHKTSLAYMAETVERFDGMIIGMSELTGKRLEDLKTKGLEVVSRVGSGLDNIDLQRAEALGITVLNTPDEPAQAVAELTIGQMIYALRIQCNYKQALWNTNNWSRNKGRLLSHQKIGIIGYGRIGRRVHHYLRAMGVPENHIWVNDIDPKTKHPLVIHKPVEDIFSECDIITVHIPGSYENEGYLDPYKLCLMKDNVILMNFSRGKIANEPAIKRICEEHEKMLYVTDVLATEPPKNYDFPNNWIITPHLGGSTVETRNWMEERAVANIMEYFHKKGHPDPGFNPNE